MMNTGFNLLGQFDEEPSQGIGAEPMSTQPSFEPTGFENEEALDLNSDSELFHTKSQSHGPSDGCEGYRVSRTN